MVLPTGFALPPLSYLVGLVGAAGAVGVGLYRHRPRVTEDVVLALTPWMVAGAVGYVLYQLDAVPSVVAPLFGSPAVYVTAAVGAGAVWLATAADDWPAAGWSLRSTPGALGVTGGLAAGSALGYALQVAVGNGGLDLFWPVAAVTWAGVVAGLTWALLRRVRPAVGVTGRAGILVVFAHALDGVSTAVGADVFGYGEQSPLSRAVLDLAASLPTAELLGSGWLFVVVKLGLAAAVLVVLVDTVRDHPSQGYLLLAGVAAVGLGPGAHNVVLFAVT